MMMHILCSLGSRGKADRHAEQHEDPGQEPDGHCQEEEEGPGRAGGQQVGHTLNLSSSSIGFPIHGTAIF